MKKVLLIGMLFFLAMGLTGCYTYVAPGEVGIKIKKGGGDRVVTSADVAVGHVTFNPIYTGVVRYPVRVERIVWTRDEHEGSRSNEEIDFNTTEGLRLTADVALSVSVGPTCAPDLYNTFKQPLDNLIDGTIRDIVRENIRAVSSQMNVEYIIGAGSNEFANLAEAGLTEQLRQMCIIVQDFSVLGTIRVPDRVAAEIHNKIQAEQEAVTEENRIRTAEARANQARATAQGEADAAVIRAQGEAESLRIRGEAIRTNPEILELQTINQWDGVLPRYLVGGDGTGLSVILPSE